MSNVPELLTIIMKQYAYTASLLQLAGRLVQSWPAVGESLT